MTIYTENGFIKYSVAFNENGEVLEEKYDLIKEKLFNESTFTASNKINSGFELDGTYIKESEVDGKKVIVFNSEALYNACPDNERVEIQTASHKIIVSKSNRTMEVYTENGYVSYRTDFTKNGTEISFNTPIYVLNKNQLFNETAKTLEGDSLYFGLEIDGTYIKKGANGFKIDFDALKGELEETENLGEVTVVYAKTDLGYSLYTTNGYMKYYREVTDGVNGSEAQFNSVSYSVLAENLDEDIKNTQNKTFAQAKTENANLTPQEFIRDIQGDKAAEAFRSEMASFLWVKNIWVTDGAHKHPVLEYEEFKTTIAETKGCVCSCDTQVSVPVREEEYNLLTAKLTEEKTSANGFYILCILSALVSLASQVIMTKSQKAQLELQTVDGQGAANQKMMTWMMPAMMAIFSFVYTSAFSIYIIINTSLGILTTILINKAVDKNFSKQSVKTNLVRGRVYVKKEEPIEDKKDKKAKRVKAEVKEEPKNTNDFLSGLADDKRPTKKIKRK